MPEFVTKTDVTPSNTDGTWTDVDVSGIVPSHCSGVYLRVVNTGATGSGEIWGSRKNGSTDDIEDRLDDGHHTFVWVGVDTDQIFEAKRDGDDLIFYVEAYYTSDEAVFLDNMADFTPGVSGGWETQDVSAHTEAGDTAVAAICHMDSSSTANRAWGVRPSDSAEDWTLTSRPNHGAGCIAGTDSNENIDTYLERFDLQDMYLVGYLTASASMVSAESAHDVQASGAYESADVSGDVNADATGVYLKVDGFTDNYNARDPARSDDEYWQMFGRHMLVGINDSDEFEQKAATTSSSTDYIGQAEASPAATTPAGSVLRTVDGARQTETGSVQTQ